jgi:hypothetical protein
MKTALIVSLALLSAPLFAQVYTPTPPGAPAAVPRARRAPQSEADPSAELNRNLTVRLEGEVAKNLKIDISVTGTGPKWIMDQMVGDDDSALTCEYQVEEKEGAFRVTYSVGVRVAVPSSRPAGPVPAGAPGQPQPFQPGVSITYRDCVIRGTVACRLGEPVEILRNGNQRLKLALEVPAAAETASPPPAPGTAPK